MNRKGQLNQVFIYIVSIIIILFVGFLVTKFVFNFSSDVEERTNAEFFEKLTTSYESIKREWNSEKIVNLPVSNQVEFACFVSSSCEDNLETDFNETELNLIIEGGDNVVLVGEESLLNSKNIGEFTGFSCSCLKPVNGFVELFVQNKRNKLVLSNIE